MKLLPELSELNDVSCWVCWVQDYDRAKHGGMGGYSKLPLSPRTLVASGWQKNTSDFPTASARIGQEVPGMTVRTKLNGVQPGKVTGVGILFPRTKLIGIDLDEIIDSNSGSMTEEASAIVRICGSYTELSPSGRGLHIIVRADNAPEFRLRKASGKADILGGTCGEYQILDTGYMTLTESKILRSRSLRALSAGDWAELLRYFTKDDSSQAGAQATASESAGTPPPVISSQDSFPAQAPHGLAGDGTLTTFDRDTRWAEFARTSGDYELLDGIFKAGSLGQKVQFLYSIGSTEGYKSHSEADQSLMCWLLDFSRSRARSISLFRGSALYRPDKEEKDPKYLERTVDFAERYFKPMIGHIEFTAKDKEALIASRYEAQEKAVKFAADPIDDTATAQPQAPSVIQQVQATAQAILGQSAQAQPILPARTEAEWGDFWSQAAGAYFDPMDEQIPEGYPISTGLTNLDRYTAGGLFPALYIIGAISSLGKTSLAVQIADHVAGTGRPVLYFSLEMSKRELRAKSLSSLMYQASMKDKSHAEPDFWTYNSTEILYPQTRHKCTPEEEPVIRGRLGDAKSEYCEGIGKRIYYLTGIGSIKASEIVAYVENFIDLHPEDLPPFVVIDYLQIVAKAEVHQTDKDKLDDAIVKFKKLSATRGIPVLAISALNRDNYSNEINESAFNGTGYAEYTADVLIGLQPQGMDKARECKSDAERKAYCLKLCEECKSSDVRHLEAKILKSRVCPPFGRAKLSYKAPFSYFKDDDGTWKPKSAPKVIINQTGQGTSDTGGAGGKGSSWDNLG